MAFCLDWVYVAALGIITFDVLSLGFLYVGFLKCSIIYKFKFQAFNF